MWLIHDYLPSATLVGEQLRYAAEYQRQWVALLVWSAAAFTPKAREAWIGWRAQQKEHRLPLVLNHSRFLVLDDCHVPNLASRVMKLRLQRLPQDWTDRYGHAVLVAENSVDSQQVQGTCYRASGAYAGQSGRWLGSEPVAEASNAIPAAQRLLRHAPLEGSRVTVDALHTQTETAWIIVQERGADYLFTVTGNQEGAAGPPRSTRRDPGAPKQRTARPGTPGREDGSPVPGGRVVRIAGRRSDSSDNGRPSRTMHTAVRTGSDWGGGLTPAGRRGVMRRS